MAYQGVRVKNPYEQPGPQRAQAPPSAPSVMPGAPIGPQAGGQRQAAPAQPPAPYRPQRQAPAMPAAPSLPPRGTGPVRSTGTGGTHNAGGQLPPTPTPTPTPTPAPTAPAGTAGLATFTSVPNQPGGFSGYGQGGVWNSSVVTGSGGGALGGGGGTGGGAGGGPTVKMNDGRTHRQRFGTGDTTVGGMRVVNPFAGESDPATQKILETLKGQGITYLPGAQSIYRLLQSGVSPENALKHYQAIYAKYGDTPNGYDAFMAGHGANFRSNIDTTLDLRQGRGFGVTGWNEGSIGPVSQNRYRPPTAKGWGSQTGTRGTPAPPAEMPVYTPGDEVTGGEPEVIGGGNRGTTPAPPRGSQGTNPPDRRLAPGATPGTYTGERGDVGGPGTLPPPPEEEPEPTPRPGRGKPGETPEWSVSPSQAQMLLTGLARLLGM